MEVLEVATSRREVISREGKEMFGRKELVIQLAC